MLMLGGVQAAADTPPEWSKSAPAYRIAEQVYFVGTAELACYLITGDQGHILINTGLKGSPEMIVQSIRSLGFDPKDIRLLLTNQAHYDHVAGFAEMRRLTGAKVCATEADAALLRNGGADDPGGMRKFAPVSVDRVLHDGETICCGGLALKVIATPGHTPGSVSYQMTLPSQGRKRTLLFVNLPTVVMPLKNARYPNIVMDLKQSFARLKALTPDIWVAAHVSQCGLAGKRETGRFEDPQGYAEAVADCEAAFEKKLAEDIGSPAPAKNP